MTRTPARTRALVLLPVTLAFMSFGVAPSLADNPKCSVNIVGVGINCKNAGTSSPSPSPSPTPSPAQPPVVEAPAPAPAPADTPAQDSPNTPSPSATSSDPEPSPTVTVIKEVIVVPSPSATPTAATPTPSEFPAAVAPHSSSDATPLPTLAIEGEAASQRTGTPDFMRQAEDAAPYMFFTGLVGLIGMLAIAKSKRLFPFEGKTKR